MTIPPPFRLADTAAIGRVALNPALEAELA